MSSCPLLFLDWMDGKRWTASVASTNVRRCTWDLRNVLWLALADGAWPLILIKGGSVYHAVSTPEPLSLCVRLSPSSLSLFPSLPSLPPHPSPSLPHYPFPSLPLSLPVFLPSLPQSSPNCLCRPLFFALSFHHSVLPTSTSTSVFPLPLSHTFMSCDTGWG